MRKEKIEVGKIYRNKTGNSAREVVAIFPTTGETPDHFYVDGLAVMLHWVEPGDVAVVYKQVRGSGIGKLSALSLQSFATWAADVDDGLAGASRRASKLRSLLGPGGKLRHVISGYAAPSESHLKELDEALAELEG